MNVCELNDIIDYRYTFRIVLYRVLLMCMITAMYCVIADTSCSANACTATYEERYDTLYRQVLNENMREHTRACVRASTVCNVCVETFQICASII